MANSNRIRPEVQQVLNGLRARIRRYVMLEGVSLVFVVFCLFFWFTLALDVGYFWISNLDLPVWLRRMMQVIVVCTGLSCFGVWVAFRLLRRLRTRALALVLERRFPELDDRLITAVEAADTTGAEQSALTVAMLNRTIEDVSREARQLDLGEVFNRVPLMRAGLMAVVLVASIGVFGITNADAMQRWARAYLELDETYWERHTTLVARVIAQPGDVVKEFVEYDDRYEYKHPRGTDLTLAIEMPDTKRPDGEDWVTPSEVQIEMREADGAGNGVRQKGIPTRHTVQQLQQDLTIWIRGGDFINRKPYFVKVVDQPRIDDLSLYCNYPHYTGLNERAGRNRAVLDTEVALPLETGFVLTATTNKPLVRVRVQTDPPLFDLSFTAESGELVLDPDGQRRVLSLPDQFLQPMLQMDPPGFRIPIRMGLRSQTELTELGPEFDELPLPPETLLRIYLEDSDGIVGLDPTRLTVRGLVDIPPEFHDFARYGISTSITRKAVVPIRGLITDDYGITKARFEYQIDADGEWKPRPFRSSPRELPREFRLQRGENEDFEQFEVLPLDLSVGQKLALTVYATDGDNLNGPHSARSQTFEFQIVSNEELLSMLYEREINLRHRMEQIIQELRDKRTDLLHHRDLAAQAEKLVAENAPSAEIAKSGNPVLVCAERSLHDVAKNQNETEAIQHTFEDILLELVNNGVHTTQMVVRLTELIVTPLEKIDDDQFPTVSAALYRMKEATSYKLGDDSVTANDTTRRGPVAAIDESVIAVERLIADLERVLAEIKDLAEFHETLKDLKEIIDIQKELSEKTRQEQKRKFIQNLKKLEDLN